MRSFRCSRTSEKLIIITQLSIASSTPLMIQNTSQRSSKIHKIKTHQNYQVRGHPYPAQHRDQGKGRVRSRGGEKFFYFSLKLFSYYLTNYLFATYCTNVEKGQVRSDSAELEKILLNFSASAIISCHNQFSDLPSHIL